MSVYKLSNVGGLKTKTAYTSFLAGNSQYVPPTYEAIATTTLATATASITFSSIPADYTHLQIRGIARSAVASPTDTFRVRFNSDTGNNYARRLVYGTGVNAVASSSAPGTLMTLGTMIGNTATASTYGTSVIDILDYKNTSKYKTLKALNGFEINSTSGEISLSSGLWMNTNAITSVTLFTDSASNLMQYSSFTLYGIRSI